MKKRQIQITVVITIIVIAIVAWAYADLHLSTDGVTLTPAYTPPTATTTPVEVAPAVSHYENSKYSFDYPSMLDTSDGQLISTADFDALATSSLFKASFKQEYMSGTNLVAATLFVGSKKTDKKSCYTTIYGTSVTASPGLIPPTMFTMNGIDYSVVSVSEGAAGNKYVTSRYSAYSSGTCYGAYMVSRSFNDIAGYNVAHPGKEVKVYDQNKLDLVLEKVIQSFAFTK